MRKSYWIFLLVIAVLIIVAFVGGRWFYYNGTGASAYTPPQRDLKQIEFEASAKSARLEAVDNPTITRGVVVIDYGHNNALFVEELNVLLSKIVNRGFSYEVVSSSEEDEVLANKLRYAHSLILPLPRADYTDEEIVEIERFVEKGGRLLIIGDPTRTVSVEALNTIAGSFGIIYANDYLYSLENNDNNYRNVVYTNFEDSPLTAGLGEDDSIIFYAGNSVNAPGHEIIIGDETTHSSTSEGGRLMAAAALTTNDQVLALGDLTFFGEPYSAAESNGTLINNVADLLTGGERGFDLKDFPFFFNTAIDVVFDDTLVFNSQFEDSVKLKEFLEETERTVTFTDEIGGSNDVIYVGRFDELEAIQEYLDAAGITILERNGDETEPEEMVPEEEEAVEPEEEEATEPEEEEAAEPEEEEAAEPEPEEATEPEEEEATEPEEEEAVEPEEEEATEPEEGEEEALTFVSDTLTDDQDKEFVEGRIQIEGAGELERGGSTLFYLHQDAGRNIFIILSDNPDTNADAFDLLLDHDFTECLLGPAIAVCQTEEPDKQLPPSMRSTRIDKILVVSDDDGRQREGGQTSLAEYRNVLSDTYKITAWVISEDGPPDLAELQEYDAIIWTTGDYWDDSIGQDEANLLTEYIQAGGNLILSGASIAFDWDHTEFLSKIVHADYLTFAEQQDIEVTLTDHPIAKGFEEGDIVTFVISPTGEILGPDVVNHTLDARVIFQRGPSSEEAGAASIIAYEDDRSKVAYYAFPVYLLPSEARDILFDNTVDWFTRKPLELPDEDDYVPFESDGVEDEDEEGESTEEETEENGEENGGEENGEDNGNNGNGEN
jgi:hypothetical protein